MKLYLWEKEVQPIPNLGREPLVTGLSCKQKAYIVHQLRHMRMLTWLDPNPTCGMTVSKGEETLAKVKDLWSMLMA